MASTAESVRYSAALQHSANHRTEVVDSDRCGCFFCFRTFAPAAIKTWIDKDQTALCPLCGIDAVIGTSAGFVLDDRFLRRLNVFRFRENADAQMRTRRTS